MQGFRIQLREFLTIFEHIILTKKNNHRKKSVVVWEVFEKYAIYLE